MKSLAIGIMMWMQANCNVPGVHESQNFCNMNFDLPVPKIVMMSERKLLKEFEKRNGSLAQGTTEIRGFYYRGVIYMKFNDYSIVEYQADLVHELAHYVQDKNNVIDWDCPPHYEIPVYLMQLHFYNKKTGRVATAPHIDIYKRDYCNTKY